jgi:hypothetical protein
LGTGRDLIPGGPNILDTVSTVTSIGKAGFNLGFTIAEYNTTRILNPSLIAGDISSAYNATSSAAERFSNMDPQERAEAIAYGVGYAVPIVASMAVGGPELRIAGAAERLGAAESGVLRTNYSVYEVLTEQSITGTGRSAHRISANKALYKDLQSNPEVAQMLNRELGADVFTHMGSGSGRNFLNPPGAVWHHPIENPSVMRLLRTSEHNNPLLQPVLHPKGVGGYSTFYGRN